MILSTCQGLRRRWAPALCSVVFFKIMEETENYILFFYPKEWIWYEGECLVLGIIFKKELSSWQAGIIWNECVLCLLIYIFKRTQEPCNFLSWNVSKCIYTLAIKWYIIRNACELGFWTEAWKGVSQRHLFLNSLQSVDNRAWIWVLVLYKI